MSQPWRRVPTRTLSKFDEALKAEGFAILAGIDEAGRGPLAGPVVTAAVIVHHAEFESPIDDSKKLTEKMRSAAYSEILQKCEISIAMRDSMRIDSINIYQATIEAMQEALDGLTGKPDLIAVDGPVPIKSKRPIRNIIQGDGQSLSIACASIVAKVTRDRIMHEYHEQFPEYGFDRHKGYGTAVHLAALRKHGPCAIHRRSFAPVSLAASGQLSETLEIME